MLNTIESINNAVNNFIWGVPAMVCIIGVGLYLSIRTNFLQIRKFSYSIRVTLGRMFRKRDASAGTMTPFQAVCTALAATVGTGNIAGVAGAIAIGGPGSVFWMWVSAILGMCTKFSEVTLAVHFREVNEKGDLVGGPMYYIKNGLGKNWRWLATLFSAFGVLTVFGTGNATQVNTITTAINSALLNYHLIEEGSAHTTSLIIGIILAALVALVLLGGIKRIGSVTEKLVPFMALFYIVLAFGVILLNINRVPAVFSSIVYGAFNPAAVTGGVVGTFFMSMKKGVSRGIFSNEAGLGTGSIAHACADTKKPVKQGFFGIYSDRICHPLQRRSGSLRGSRRRGTDHSRVYFHLWQLGLHFYSRCHVLFRIFHHHRLGIIRCEMYRVPVLLAHHQSVHDRLLSGRNPGRHHGFRDALEYRRNL